MGKDTNAHGYLWHPGTRHKAYNPPGSITKDMLAAVPGPEIPANVLIHYFVREAKTHLIFHARIKWDSVTNDTAGDVLDTVDEYEVQYRATDVAGVPVELDPADSNKTLIRGHRKVAVQKIKVIDATTSAGVFTFTVDTKENFKVGDSVVISGVLPEAYNGTFTIASVPTSTTFTTTGIGGTADLTDEGKAEDNNDTLHVTTQSLPRPKTWYWQARVRAHAGKAPWDSWGTWSDWTVPSLPWTGADPKPPVPTGLTLTYDRVGKHRHHLYRGRAEWHEVLNWDIPGGDQEPDVAGYAVKVEISEDGGSTWDPFGHHMHRDASPENGNPKAHVTFHRVHKKYWYRVAVRSIDRFHRRGDWSGWVSSQGGDNIKPTSPSIVADISAVRRVGVRWQVPLDGNVPDPTVAHIHFQISKSSGFGALVDEGYKAPGHGSHRYAVPAADASANHYMRIRSIDTEGNLGDWVPNASPGELLNGELDSGGVPVGTIHKWSGHIANIPAGYLNCDGSAVSRLTYSALDALYALAGYPYGAGDGTTTFNVPDHRGRHGIGVSSVSALGANEGLAENLRGPIHTHAADATATAPTLDTTLTTPGSDATSATPPSDYTVTTPASDITAESGHTHGASTLSTGNPVGGSGNSAGGGSAGQGHQHDITSGRTGSTDGHNHNHNHAGHGHSHGHGFHSHGHGHGSHNHSHTHGSHGHSHGHDAKTRPHLAHHYIVKF